MAHPRALQLSDLKRQKQAHKRRTPSMSLHCQVALSQ
jgi:hypothetical protein